MDRDRHHGDDMPLLSVMITARLGGPAPRRTEDERRAVADGPAAAPSRASLWERLIAWLRL